MGHGYDKSKKIVLKTILILGAVTVAEVLVALTGKGYLIEGFEMATWLMNMLMISMSAFKAYLIVYEFMHMKYEVKALSWTVVLPTLLLVWAVIAFLYEGDAWKGNRDLIKSVDEKVTEKSIQPLGGVRKETKQLEAIPHSDHDGENHGQEREEGHHDEEHGESGHSEH